jgi:hypothetical protein
MLLDRMGYILIEGITLLAIISFTKGILFLRRGRQRFLSRADRELLFRPIQLPASAAERFVRYGMTALAVMVIGAVEIFYLAPFGAAIVTGALLVTCATIVQFGLTTTYS